MKSSLPANQIATIYFLDPISLTNFAVASVKLRTLIGFYKSHDYFEQIRLHRFSVELLRCTEFAYDIQFWTFSKSFTMIEMNGMCKTYFNGCSVVLV